MNEHPTYASPRKMPTVGRVSIRTENPDALKAIHDFLGFQITDHHTGYATDIGLLDEPTRYACTSNYPS